MRLALTDRGRKYMEKLWSIDFEPNYPFRGDKDDVDDQEEAANVLSLFETFGPVIEAEQVYEYARQETDKKDSYMDWREEPLERDYINSIVRRLFEARYLEEVQEYDEDNILMTMNPTALSVEEVTKMHQQAKLDRMRH